MNRRGVTLVEVLAAIFIMGIGLLALLTLFPLGALSMANSVRDNNAAAAGSAALSIAQAFDLRNDPNVIAGLQTPPSVVVGGSLVAGLPIQPNGPGYPIFVDPIYASFSANIGFIPPTQVGQVPVTPGIRRIAPFFNNYTAQAKTFNLPALTDRYFTYLDDVTWDANGMPRDPSGLAANPSGVPQQIDRPGSLSWAYMIRPSRRAANQVTTTFPIEPLAEMSVVVYRNRSLNTLTGETPYLAQGAMGSTTLSLFYPTTTDLRIGDFILDTTFDIAADPLNPTTNFFGSVHGYFYKVVDILDTPSPSGGTLTLTLATPLRMNVVSQVPPGSVIQPTTGQVVHLKNVVDVQERGLGPKP